MLEIIETHGESKYGPTYEVGIKKDGKTIKGFDACGLCDCPEDATLTRDLHYAYSAVDFFKLGYEAGQAGEEVTYQEVTYPRKKTSNTELNIGD